MDEAAGQAHSDDTAKARKILPEHIKRYEDSPPLSNASKEKRGFNHPILGAFLCPTHLDWEEPTIRLAFYT